MAIAQASLMVYDIPESSDFPNPSPRLRRIGFRVNLSCWVVPNDRIPHYLISQLQEAGSTVEVVKFDTSETEALVRMATAALKIEINAAVRAAQEKETAELEKIGESDDPIEAHAAYWRRVRASLSRARRLLKDAQSAAAAFGITSGEFDFANAERAIRGISTNAKCRASVYAAMAKKLRATGTRDGATLARAVEADAVHPLIAADYLEERDQCEAAKAVRTAFATT